MRTSTFVTKERWKRPKARSQFLGLVPDLVVEILSPSSSKRDRTQKKRIYERNGVREYWLVDSRRRRITRFLSSDGRFEAGVQFHVGEELTSSVLPGFAISVAEAVADE